MYTLVNAIVTEIDIDGTMATPMVGYLLKNEEDGSSAVYSRREAYDLILEKGSDNAEAKTRLTSCIEDRPDEKGLIHYLKLKSKDVKINSLLVNWNDLPFMTRMSEGFVNFCKECYGFDPLSYSAKEESV